MSKMSAKIVFVAASSRCLIANRGDLIRQLISLGHSVSALVPKFDADEEALNSLGIPFEFIGLDRRHMNPLKDLKSCNELRIALNRLKPDVVFSYTIKPVVYGTLAARLAGVPHVTAMICGLGYLFSGRSLKARIGRVIARCLYAVTFPLNNVVFFQNPDDLSEVGYLGGLPLFRKAVVVAGSGVNLNQYLPQPLPVGPPKFLMVTRLLKDKGVVEFCESALRLHLDYPEVKFEILGPHDPDLPNALSDDSVRRYRESGAVTFHPPVEDVRRFLAGCSVFVLPSMYREGTPRAILEAMATGRGIITSDAPGCRETVAASGEGSYFPGQNGFLVKAGDVDSLTEAMGMMIESPELMTKAGERSLEIARNKYNVSIVNREVIRDLVPVRIENSR